MAHNETMPTPAKHRKLKYTWLAALAAIVLVAIALYWFNRCGGEHPSTFVGTWKVESAPGEMQNIRYRFFADGTMWTYANLDKTVSTWHVSEDGELVVTTDLAAAGLPKASPGQMLVDLAQAVRDPCYSRGSIKFSVEGFGDRLTLTETETFGLRPTNPQKAMLKRVIR